MTQTDKEKAELWRSKLLAYLSSKHIDTSEFYKDLQKAIKETNDKNQSSSNFERKYDGYFDGSYTRKYKNFYSFYGSYKRATFLENLSDNDDYRLAELEMRQTRLSENSKHYIETEKEIEIIKERIKSKGGKKKPITSFRDVKHYEGLLSDYEMSAIREAWQIKEIKENNLVPCQQVDIRIFYVCYQLDDNKRKIGVISKRFDKKRNRFIKNDYITFTSGLSQSDTLIELRNTAESKLNEWLEMMEQSNLLVEIITYETIIVRLGL